MPDREVITAFETTDSRGNNVLIPVGAVLKNCTVLKTGGVGLLAGSPYVVEFDYEASRCVCSLYVFQANTLA